MRLRSLALVLAFAARHEPPHIRALLGSAAWARSQVDIAALCRHPGSALKPFVYATAIEAGASPAAIAADAADVPSSDRVEHPRAAQSATVNNRTA